MSKVDETSSDSNEWSDESAGAYNETPPWADLHEQIARLDIPATSSIYGGLLGASLMGEIESHKHERRAQLFGPFWYERELAILAGKTGSGKSALAMQIAMSICTGRELGGFGPARCTNGRPVLYIDFENEIDDWVERIGGAPFFRELGELYRMRWDSSQRVTDWPETIARAIIEHRNDRGTEVVVLDNVSWLLDFGSDRNDLHERTALLMQRLDQVCKNEGIAVLVIAHTTKAKTFAPFELGDIAGSSILQKYVRSIFALGETYGQPGGRYLKQLKSRQAAMEYHNEVAAFDLRMHEGYLHMVRDEGRDGQERLHLKTDAPEQGTKKERILQYLREHPGASDNEVAEALGCARGTVHHARNHAV
jgi:hypothetical protein